MKATPTRKRNQAQTWPKRVQPGRAIVKVYRRKTPAGNLAYMVANYADGDSRRFDSYADEVDALAAAEKLARRIDSRDYVAASMTRTEAIEFANAATRLKPFNVTVDAATATVAECLKSVGDLANLHAAVKFYAARHKQTVKKPVADVVAEFLKIKEARGASDRYMKDLRGRLDRFANDCRKDTVNVTTADIQDWLDGLKLKPQNYRNFRTVLHTLFKFAVSRAYAADNPVEGVERVRVNGGDVEIFTPTEITRLIETAKEHFPDFLPCLAIGAFAGLRSAEIERLEWSDIHLAERFIVVGASKAKTASRRIVPIHDNLAAWLAPYANRPGKIWTERSVLFYKNQEAVATATAVEADAGKNIAEQKAVKWKSNALRHSYASYRFSQIGDAGRVAGELGNSAKVVHRHYRELVKPADAVKWFNVKPETPANVVTLAATNS
jgi:site-specific recombinase XerD